MISIFSKHLAIRIKYLEKTLSQCAFDALVISSGKPTTYFINYENTIFNTVPHFHHYCPLPGPHHLLYFKPGKKPKLICYATNDFWHEQVNIKNTFWINEFDLVIINDFKKIWQQLNINSLKIAYIGNEIESAKQHKMKINPIKLIALLDLARTYKTSYELKCIEEATVRTVKGHIAGQKAFFLGASELDIHFTFLKATNTNEINLPFPTIIAINEKSAIMHYQNKRQNITNGNTLLMDCGTNTRGYSTDVTRTITNEKCHPIFQALIKNMYKIQYDIINLIYPNQKFNNLHHIAHFKIANMLKEYNILYSQPQTSVDLGISKKFFPHKLWHHIGMQVHDANPHILTSLENHINQSIKPCYVIAVEVGCYFIKKILEPLRNTKYTRLFNWPLIEQLYLCGGIRIEDNIFITDTSSYNITKKYFSKQLS